MQVWFQQAYLLSRSNYQVSMSTLPLRSNGRLLKGRLREKKIVIILEVDVEQNVPTVPAPPQVIYSKGMLSVIGLVWQKGQSHWWTSHQQGREVCVCVYVYTICDLSDAVLWNVTRNTLFIPLGRPGIKIWRIGYLLSQSVIHEPLCICVCCLIPTLARVTRLYCRGWTNKRYELEEKVQ